MPTLHELDTRGLNCPLPILRLKKALNALAGGDELRMTSTDPGSVKDVESFCKQAGHQLVEAAQQGADFVFRVRKG